MAAEYKGPLAPEHEAAILEAERALEAEGRRLEMWTFRNQRKVPLPVEAEEEAPAAAVAAGGAAAAAGGKPAASAAAGAKKPAPAPPAPAKPAAGAPKKK